MGAALSAYRTIRSRRNARNVDAWIEADRTRYDYYGYLKQLSELGVEETHQIMKDMGLI